jgi:hypothetical protein
MTPFKTAALLAALMGAGWATAPASAQADAPRVERGTLTDDDDRLGDDSPFDLYTVEARAGDTIVIEMVSDEVDTYVGITADFMDDAEENDDAGEGTTNSRVELVAPEDGEYQVIATCYDPADRGDYTLTIAVTPAGDAPVPEEDDEDMVDAAPAPGAGAGEVPAVRVELNAEEPRVEEGELTDGSPQLDNGKPFDAYTFRAEAGQHIALDMHSDDLDTYLVLLDAEGNVVEENDDHNGSRRHSHIQFTAPEDGEYTVQATCFDADDRGVYTLTFGSFTAYSGELAEGDTTLPNGEYIDWYDIECEAGQLMLLEINGEGFDTYLIFEDPMGSWEENDDAGDTLTSRIESNIFMPGTYRIGVTSFEGGETGTYTLSISTSEGYLATPVGGGTIHAEFDGSEPVLTEHGYVDAYAFEAEQGNTVIITMRSDDVDTVLKLKGPGQLNELVDDFEPGSTDSQMAFRVSESGTYYLSATTFRGGETGGYALELDLEANKHDAGEWAVNEGGTVYGVFVGINDYPEGGSDLPYCDADATRTARAFRRHFDMDRDHSVVLTNSEATPEEIRKAIAEVGAMAGPEDMFVFFYSGHGDQVPRPSGPDVADPDGNDETLAAYGGDISDDEFAALLDEIHAGTTMVVIDACFSGGFAKDVVTKPGRIGLFSSEGDCLSMVAEKYQAGGYLSLFFTEAFNKDKELADLNGDRMLTAHELTFYLQSRFDEVVQSGPRGQASRLYPNGAIDPGSNLGYQRIISDRDGVSPHIILLDW